MSTTVFPVDGAANAAELFALLAGHSNATDFVDDGLTVSVDTNTDTATVSAGTCYIQLDSDTIAGTSKQVRDLGYAVQLDEQTVSVPTSGTVTLAVVPDYSTPNKAAIEYYSTATDVPSGALSIATVDCDSGTVTAYNRAPDIDAESLSVVGEATISGDLTVAQDIVLDGQLKQADGTVLFGPDDPIPSAQLSDSAVTIQTSGDLTGGGSVALGDSVTLGTDVPVTSVHGRTGSVSAATGDYTHAQIAAVSADDHHAYPVPNAGLVNDTMTVSAGGDLTGGGQVTLGESVEIGVDIHEKYTDAEAVSAVDTAITVAASSVNSLDSQVSTNVSNISSLQSNKLDQSSYSPESDTHDRYSDTEAVSAVDAQVSTASGSVSGLDSQVSTNVSNISSLQSNKLDQSSYNPESDTHSRYTNSEAVSAVDSEISAAADSVTNLDAQVNTNASNISSLQSNKLEASAYTPEADTHDAFLPADAVTAIDGEISSAASTISSLDTQVSTNTTDISALQSGKLDQSAYNPESDTHNRYTDSEAVSAINGKLSAAASTISALDTAVNANAGAIDSLQTNKLDSGSYTPESDTHSRYADSEAVSAVDSEVTDAASSVSGLDTAVYNNDTDISALQSQAHAEQHGAGQHNTDALHTNAVGVPVYATVSDVPSLAEGRVVYIQDDNSLYVEDGS